MCFILHFSLHNVSAVYSVSLVYIQYTMRDTMDGEYQRQRHTGTTVVL